MVRWILWIVLHTNYMLCALLLQYLVPDVLQLLQNLSGSAVQLVRNLLLELQWQRGVLLAQVSINHILKWNGMKWFEMKKNGAMREEGTIHLF